MKRVMSLFLCSALLLSSLAACSEGGETETDTASSAVQTEAETTGTAESTEPEKYKADIPAGTKYDGMTFTVTTYPNDGGIWGDVDWSATEYTSEVLNDAVYSRMLQVEELLDVDIQTAYHPFNDIQTLGTSVTANDNAYQLYSVHADAVITAASGGMIQSVNEFAGKGTLDMEAPWWDQNCFRDFSIAHKNYCMIGDIGTMYKKSIAALMFNKKILEENQLENPYELMQNGQWTVDKVVELGSKISNDLNGDGQMTQEDQYGLICFCNMIATAMVGCDVPFFTKDENDMPVNTFYTERSVAVMDKLAALMYDENLSYSWSRKGVGELPAFKMYQTDKALFYYGELHAVATMREMESPFGIMPMPKYDETQEGYHHAINTGAAPVYLLPITNTDYERCGYIIDALGAASKNELTPAYYDVTLQGKVSRDEESSASLDIIINSIRYDLGCLNNWGLLGMLYPMADSGNADLASQYKRVSKIITKSLERTINKLNEQTGEAVG